MESIGERIKFIRKSRKVTQEMFSKELGISQAHVSKLENGKENPSDLLLNFVSYRYCVNREWLKTGQGKMDNSGGLSKDASINSLHMYTYELETLYNNLNDDQIYQITNSMRYFTSIIREICNCPQLKNGNQIIEYITKIEEIYSNLWSINTMICETYKKKDAGTYFKINSAILKIQEILTYLCTISH